MYSAFGLSWDIPWEVSRFPEAQAVQPPREQPRVEVTICSHVQCLAAGNQPVGPLRQVDAAGRLRLRVPGAGVFRVDGRAVEFAAEPECDEGLRDLVLASSVANVVLRNLGFTPVHGAAVAWKGRAALFIGPAAIGTSSLATALMLRGFTMLGDDLLALQRVDDSTVVWGGGHDVQLPSDVVAAFGERLAGKVAPSRPEVALTRHDVRFSPPSKPFPLAAIYLIDANATEHPHVAALRGTGRIEALMATDWHLPVRRKMGYYSDDFVNAARLSGSVAMRRVSRLDTNSLHVGALSKVVASDVRRVVNSEISRAC